MSPIGIQNKGREKTENNDNLCQCQSVSIVSSTRFTLHNSNIASKQSAFCAHALWLRQYLAAWAASCRPFTLFIPLITFFHCPQWPSMVLVWIRKPSAVVEYCPSLWLTDLHLYPSFGKFSLYARRRSDIIIPSGSMCGSNSDALAGPNLLFWGLETLGFWNCRITISPERRDTPPHKLILMLLGWPNKPFRFLPYSVSSTSTISSMPPRCVVETTKLIFCRISRWNIASNSDSTLASRNIVLNGHRIAQKWRIRM